MMRVQVLRWPTEAPRRERLRGLGVPRLLIVEGRERPPSAVDPLEDWVRSPASPHDIRCRLASLEHRAQVVAPVLDEHGVLRFGGRRAMLSPTEAGLMRALLDAYESVVPRERLVRAWPWETPSRNAVDLCVLRLRRRIAPLDLAIRTVWRKGYLLEAAGDTP